MDEQSSNEEEEGSDEGSYNYFDEELCYRPALKSFFSCFDMQETFKLVVILKTSKMLE